MNKIDYSNHLTSNIEVLALSWIDLLFYYVIQIVY